MKKFLSIVKKDSLILIRDWPALSILFIMPAILMVIITLTQERTILTRKSEVKMILVNADSSSLGDSIANDLIKSGYFNFTKFYSAKEAENAVLQGTYQMALIIPEGSTEILANLSNTSRDIKEIPNEGMLDDLAGIKIIYDPAVQSIYKDAITLPLKMIVQLSAVKVIMAQYAENVNNSLKQQLSDYTSNLRNKDFSSSLPDSPNKDEMVKKMRDEMAKNPIAEPDIKLPANPIFTSDLVKIKEQVAQDEYSTFKPNPLQNNIPAFTLFAMFFIVIPLAGSIINEKDQGTYDRLRTLPVSYLGVVSAKITVFIIVCIFQFVFLMFIGMYIMPMLGNLPSLDLRVSYPALILALIASSLAATGFGILIGTFADTHGQAATFGSVMVVILAMLGGIFVPAHMMPDLIKKISLVSPLRWGTDAFLGVFARNGSIDRIWHELFLLIAFFCISLALSVKMLNSRK